MSKTVLARLSATLTALVCTTGIVLTPPARADAPPTAHPDGPMPVDVVSYPTGGGEHADRAEHNWYLGFSGGWEAREDVHEAENNGTFLKLKDGFVINGALGHSWGPFRAEAEFSLFNNNVPETGIGGPTGATTSQGAASGNITVYSYMFNFYYDLTIEGLPVKPYFGAGIGCYHSEINSLTLLYTNPVTVVNCASNYPFAYQFKAGVSYELSERTDIFAGYRFFDGGKLTFSASAFGGVFQPKSAEFHCIEVGLRVKF